MTRSHDLSMPNEHSAAWIFQTWASFLLSTSAVTIGIFFLPVNGWMKGYLGVGFTFSLASTMSLSKTIRDRGRKSVRDQPQTESVRPVDGTHFDDLPANEFDPLAIEEAMPSEFVVLLAGPSPRARAGSGMRSRWSGSANWVNPANSCSRPSRTASANAS